MDCWYNFFISICTVLLTNMMQMTKELTIGVVDDHAVYMEGLEGLLKDEKRRVVMMAKNSKEMSDLLQKNTMLPEIILISIDLDKSIEIMQEIKQSYPQVKIMMLATESSNGKLSESIKEGANGILFRHSSLSEFDDAFKEVRKGNVYLPDGFE